MKLYHLNVRNDVICAESFATCNPIGDEAVEGTTTMSPLADCDVKLRVKAIAVLLLFK